MAVLKAKIVVILLAAQVLSGLAPAAAAVRLKDIAQVQGVRDNQLVGYGVVIGLNGSGDSNASGVTAQSLASMFERLGLKIDKNEVAVRNVAAVIVTATLPPFAKTGSRIDCVVSSVGNASSLQGGTLLMTPLSGADGLVYAVAQGALSIGGFNAGTGGAGGSTVQRNHPTVARIPEGALIEREVPMAVASDNIVRISLRQPDFTTCDRVVQALSAAFGQELSISAEDAATVRLEVLPTATVDFVNILARLERVEIIPDAPAKIVINERTGTIVAGEHTRISTVAVSHGNLSIEIKSRVNVSQPQPFSRTGTTVAAPDVETTVSEEQARLVVMNAGVNIAEVAGALNALGVTPRDMIAIFQAMRVAGALRAELVIM